MYPFLVNSVESPQPAVALLIYQQFYSDRLTHYQLNILRVDRYLYHFCAYLPSVLVERRFYFLQSFLVITNLNLCLSFCSLGVIQATGGMACTMARLSTVDMATGHQFLTR